MLDIGLAVGAGGGKNNRLFGISQKRGEVVVDSVRQPPFCSTCA